VINRQHHTTQIPQLVGKECEELIGIGNSIQEGIYLFFIKLSGDYYRFFIDEGVLFWDEATKEDLDEEDGYLDLLLYYKTKLGKIKNISMKNSSLTIEGEQKQFLFKNNNGLTFIEYIA